MGPGSREGLRNQATLVRVLGLLRAYVNVRAFLCLDLNCNAISCLLLGIYDFGQLTAAD